MNRLIVGGLLLIGIGLLLPVVGLVVLAIIATISKLFGF